MQKLYFCYIAFYWFKGDYYESETNVFAFKTRKQRKNFLERKTAHFEKCNCFQCVELGNLSPVKSGYMLIEYKNGKKVETFYPYTL